ncbi:MAG: anaerobic sulfite reductase subunit AsrA [Peptostreptococcaceae bacterium]|nr:anaerobic sulfite reductase subunit AsrA [Peptostreptococcaceae bacterium]
MGYELTHEEFDKVLGELAKSYDLFAPVRLVGRGRFSDTDNIRYEKISSVTQIEHKEKSMFSAKEIAFPVTETMFHIVGEQLTEAQNDIRETLVFVRSCDIHAMKRMDDIFLNNGLIADPYYKRKRDKIKFVLMECKKSFENCFCVSMGTNQTSNYEMAIGFDEGKVYIAVQDEKLNSYFEKSNMYDFTPAFVTENSFEVNVPNAEDIGIDLFNDALWDEYTRRCIACGRCNFVCPTCSCFTSTDISYDDNGNVGERKRVWAGCHVDKFTDMAGGHTFRKDNGSRMRFKTMHKIYDFKKIFGTDMCVGCGRCDDRCPEYISFANCINKVSNKIAEQKEVR